MEEFMDIKAAVAREKGANLTIENLTLEDPRDDEVLVRVVGCGVCHTDLAIRDQYYPTPLPCVLGHEGSGVVEKVGANVSTLKPGDHVVMSYLGCGKCNTCLSGQPYYCPNFFQYDFSGGRADGSSPITTKSGERVNACFFSQSTFATYALASERNTVKVSKDLPLEMLGPLGCGIQTGAGAVMNALHPKAGSSIAVFGVGTVGISAIMAAKVCGCTKIIAVDINKDRLETAKEFGATHGVNGMDEDAVEAIRAITGAGVDFSLEAIGNPKVLRQAVDALNNSGTCGLIGAAPMGVEASIDMNTILFGRTLRGIIEGNAVPHEFIPKLIDLYLAGQFPIDKMVTYYDFNDLNQAIEDMENGKVLKGIVKM